MDVFEMNAAGYFAAANAPNFFDPAIRFTIGSDEVINFTPVPEPGSMLLLASGPAVEWRAGQRPRST